MRTHVSRRYRLLLRCTSYASCAAFVGLCRQHYSRWSCRWCCPVWIMANNATLAGLHGNQLDRLQSVINAAARLVCSARKYEHITPLFSDLHWLPVRERIEFKLAVLVFRCLHGMARSAVPGERAVSYGGHRRKKTAAFCVNVLCSHNAVIASFDDW